MNAHVDVKLFHSFNFDGVVLVMQGEIGVENVVQVAFNISLNALILEMSVFKNYITNSAQF